ncbi:adenylate cyclase type 3 [Cylas formicarius]|uniref:adenylate cyclase type 3 n=1 Tax=Cylas formicarius TaxID=197179 RepID=UPI0029588C6C|nr:adenylate cyclase type 3 [Cylas formicarius]XP_060518106.1 adenylate cyclase type 3 [Cylas formicarius]XP_060518107.1 adenylate cyclase type 3 [Cylas formicarius]XP_060518108.1 adenylate cyclase type 3 [Cylas formicarius]XP_060518109.1 adenylate cyclase type 3 [Cylas formicarius]XP_060518110.1 adenylate cyclase type 3 [Cylas formicarius]XP_060518111.1 adenylate cyclase type 3 [Cylas formicarius]
MKDQQKDGRASSKMREVCHLFSTFKDKSLEWLYQSFSVKQKRAGLQCFLVTAILFDIYMLVVPNAQDVGTYTFMAVFLVMNTFLLIWCKKGFENEVLWAAFPHVSWHIANTQVLAALFLNKNDVTSRDSLGWVLLLDYLVYVTLPLRLRYCFILSVMTCLSYTAALIYLTVSDLHMIEQHVANVVLLITSNILGLTSYLLEDKQQRRAFLETRQSLEVKLVIEEQSAEQERLLLSVLPEHVAVQMRQDLDQADSQFKKIYMSRHENVSILYADIVGFTAISSTYSAQELVKMLNELFARFDKLAEKYHQLRIKILGDCYYCISGAPVERPDHAVLCVHMGLSMVKAIKYVQQTANSPVDMRVGIHTGAVLAGVLGQRQWQFDVYSKDVELANKMESSGLAGRVHISATTLSFLSGEFEVEPAYGEKRDEALRIAGLKTYFIVRVLKPFEPQMDVQNGDTIIPDADSCVISDLKGDKEDQANGIESNRAREDSADFKIRLRKELVNRDGHKELSKNTKFVSLAFTDPQKEKSYHVHTETFSSFTLFMFFIVRLAIGLSMFIVLPSDLSVDITYCVENVVFIILVLIAIAEEFPAVSRCWTTFKESMLLRRILSTMCVILIGTINVVDTISCVRIQEATNRENCSDTDNINEACLYPSYFTYFAVLILIASSLPACLSYLWKTFLMVIISASQCFVNIFVLPDTLDCGESEDYGTHWTSLTKGKSSLSGLLLTATLALAFLARHMEQVARVLFLWRSEVEEQRHCAEDMKRRNEALVYNILPPHVAAHFMGNKNRSHDELYSQSYAEVGVLFASMPNFSDFYSEETVNNQGLECLRFLNEVISDFDALLELPQYQDNIIKIKTIGSTYMAASGLNPTRQIKPDDPTEIRWAHLALLVEFALDLKKALQSINEQSFNHFVLKLGINHGPITAGVIGARKPHYDIWGNTVNVASRMESTGKVGCIQVTEETCQILQAFGYQFEQRGLVAVKGKGQLMTYYLLGKAGKITPPTVPVSPEIGVSTMETVNEEDESSKSDEKTVIECSDKVDDEVFNFETENSEQEQKEDENQSKDSNEATLLLSNCDS